MEEISFYVTYFKVFPCISYLSVQITSHFYDIILTTTLTYKDSQFHTCTLLTTETNLHYPGSKCDHHAESLREASIHLPGEPVTLFSIADDMMATKLHPFRAVEYKLVP